eukprot:g6555.t1
MLGSIETTGEFLGSALLGAVFLGTAVFTGQRFSSIRDEALLQKQKLEDQQLALLAALQAKTNAETDGDERRIREEHDRKSTLVEGVAPGMADYSGRVDYNPALWDKLLKVEKLNEAALTPLEREHYKQILTSLSKPPTRSGVLFRYWRDDVFTWALQLLPIARITTEEPGRKLVSMSLKGFPKDEKIARKHGPCLHAIMKAIEEHTCEYKKNTNSSVAKLLPELRRLPHMAPLTWHSIVSDVFDREEAVMGEGVRSDESRYETVMQSLLLEPNVEMQLRAQQQVDAALPGNGSTNNFDNLHNVVLKLNCTDERRWDVTTAICEEVGGGGASAYFGGGLPPGLPTTTAENGDKQPCKSGANCQHFIRWGSCKFGHQGKEHAELKEKRRQFLKELQEKKEKEGTKGGAAAAGATNNTKKN